MIRLKIYQVGILFLCGSLWGCAGCSQKKDQPANSTKTNVLRLATTTSVRDSGLLDQLLPLFESRNDCRVDVVAVGTGAALKLGESGDADALLVHAPEAEKAFMDAGHGTRREELMYNYFIILGPADDPAKIRGLDAVEAFRKIAAGKFRFLSRGDDSGTHKRELALWQEARMRPAQPDYIETGQGMGTTLTMAFEMQGYVLADEGTYLNFKDKIDLVKLSGASESLINRYSVITVNPDKSPKIDYDLAARLADFLISREGQQLINDYQIAGQQLFFPKRLQPAD